jgi:hypothetical protein
MFLTRKMLDLAIHFLRMLPESIFLAVKESKLTEQISSSTICPHKPLKQQAKRIQHSSLKQEAY